METRKARRACTDCCRLYETTDALLYATTPSSIKDRENKTLYNTTNSSSICQQLQCNRRYKEENSILKMLPRTMKSRIVITSSRNKFMWGVFWVLVRTASILWLYFCKQICWDVFLCSSTNEWVYFTLLITVCAFTQLII